MLEEVLVCPDYFGIYYSEDFEDLVRYEPGDLVICADCGELMLVPIGGTICVACEGENLVWYDKDMPEWTIAELEAVGFFVIEV